MTIQVENRLPLPALAIHGLVVSNDATTPDSKVNISAGACRDSNNKVDMVLGAANADEEGRVFAAPLVIDAATNGANGLDASSLVASKVYAVYLIGDSRGYKAPAGLLSLATATPLMPSGYDSIRKLGFVATDGSSNFLAGYSVGEGSSREWRYDAVPTLFSGVSGTSYVPQDISAFVPNQDNAVVLMQLDFSANAVGDIMQMRKFGSAGDQLTIRGLAATADITTLHGTVLVGLDSGVAKVDVKVSAGSVDAFAVGFSYSV